MTSVVCCRSGVSITYSGVCCKVVDCWAGDQFIKYCEWFHGEYILVGVNNQIRTQNVANLEECKHRIFKSNFY